MFTTGNSISHSQVQRSGSDQYLEDAHKETLIKRTDCVPPWFGKKKGALNVEKPVFIMAHRSGWWEGGGTKISPSIEKFKRAVQYESKGGLAITLRCYFYITCCSRLSVRKTDIIS